MLLISVIESYTRTCGNAFEISLRSNSESSRTANVSIFILSSFAMLCRFWDFLPQLIAGYKKYWSKDKSLSLFHAISNSFLLTTVWIIPRSSRLLTISTTSCRTLTLSGPSSPITPFHIVLSKSHATHFTFFAGCLDSTLEALTKSKYLNVIFAVSSLSI